MNSHRTALITLLILTIISTTSFTLGINGEERVKTIDVYIDPANPGSVSYTVYLVNGLAIEGSSDSWEAMDQMLRLSEAVTKPNTTVHAILKDDKITSFRIRAVSMF